MNNLGVRTTKALIKKLWLLTQKQTTIPRRTTQSLKKKHNCGKQNFEDEANNMQFDKQDAELNKSKRNSCVKNILNPIVSCTISSIVDYDLILQYEARVNAIWVLNLCMRCGMPSISKSVFCQFSTIASAQLLCTYHAENGLGATHALWLKFT